MRRWMLAAGMVCTMAAASEVQAQLNAPSPAGQMMPGTVVGTSSGTINRVGQQFPQAAPQAGLPVSANGMMRPYDPARPFDMFKGTNIDPKQVLAPLVGPDGKPVQPPDGLDLLTEKLKSFLGLAGSTLPRPPYTPGIARRNRERAHDRMWRRD